MLDLGLAETNRFSINKIEENLQGRNIKKYQLYQVAVVLQKVIEKIPEHPMTLLLK